MTDRNRKIPEWKSSDLDKTLLMASHYGFVPVQSPSVIQQDIDITSDCDPHPHYNASEKAAFLRTFVEKGLSHDEHPLAIAYEMKKPGRAPSNHAFELIGYPSGIAEAILIRASLSALLDKGYKHLVIDINCIGDKESISSYEKELQNFLKKTGSNLSPETKKELRKDPFNLVKMNFPDTEELKNSIPHSIAHLSTHSRNYFKEVLEYVEALEVEFHLAPHLVGDKNYCSHTIFAIRNNETEDRGTLAVGYCYSRLSKRFGFKKEVPLVGATVFGETTKEKSSRTKKTKKVKSSPKAKFYLVQLGREAKMRSLNVIELLRREKIPVYHLLGRDKITTQFSTAQEVGVPYVIIIGQKEALEQSVIVRNVSTHSQETVNLDSLPVYLKNITL